MSFSKNRKQKTKSLSRIFLPQRHSIRKSKRVGHCLICFNGGDNVIFLYLCVDIRYVLEKKNEKKSQIG
jgi:hypothetical protein